MSSNATEGKKAEKGSDPKDTKRKAAESPETETPLPRLRRRPSLPDLQDAVDPKKSYSLPELMKRGLLDPDIMKDIVPTIMIHLAPSIEETIRRTMETTLAATVTSAIEKSMDTYRTEVIQPLLAEKDAEISELKSELKQTTRKARGLESKVNKLSQGLNDLEQYGRRQNIRLNNVPLPDATKCEEVTLTILNETLPLEVEALTPSDIERCHPIGKVNKKNNRQVIVKFSSYKAKAKAYSARFRLSNIYMTEDFTPSNQKIVSQLIHLKKAKNIQKFWSNDGKIFAKVVDAQEKFRIKSKQDIIDMFQNALDEGYINADDIGAAALLLPEVATDPGPDDSE